MNLWIVDPMDLHQVATDNRPATEPTVTHHTPMIFYLVMRYFDVFVQLSLTPVSTGAKATLEPKRFSTYIQVHRFPVFNEI